MKHVFHPLLWFFTCITLSYAADILQNPDFEIPPANVTANATSQFLLLNKENSLPGWSFNGTVWYVTSGGDLSLPGNSHAIQLGENGKINQTFKSTDAYLDYILTFTLAVQNEYCGNKNFTAVSISVLKPVRDRLSQVLFLERNFTRNLWQSYAIYLGTWASKRDSINIEIKSVTTNLEQNVSCWPVVDSFIVKRNWQPIWQEGNMLANGDFEIGPAFPKNSSNGILLTYEETEAFHFHSPLQEWKILGTIKYIDSEHFKVPRGKAAIELISGDPSGIQIDSFLQRKSTYRLNFTIGDANDSCAGFFIVYLQIGNEVMNFTLQSNGTGSAFKHSITFKPETESPSTTYITFYSFNETRTSDGVLCGPVLDNIILDNISHGGSYRQRIQLYHGVMISSLFFALTILI